MSLLLYIYLNYDTTPYPFNAIPSILLFKYTQGVSLIKQIPEIQNTEMYQYYLELIDKTIAAIEEEYN